MVRGLLGEDHITVFTVRRDLAVIRMERGDHAEAGPELGDCLAAITQQLGKDHWEAALATYELGRSLAEQGRLPEAEELYAGSLPLLARPDNTPAETRCQVLEQAISFYDQHHQPDIAAQYRLALASARSD
jgi:hypothetical protein